ncbi:hypothetical protein F5888DRAFT_1733461 [Russula emetica]|nr:hypothetical protein F5888DRAFT_1733461 [Russula emetica]
MASYSYYPSPSTPFSGAARSSTPDTYQRPPSAQVEKLSLYSTDVYASAPPTGSPLQPYPVQVTRFPGRSHSPRPESPAQIGKPASGWSIPQAPEPQLPVQKTFKTFLQWKAEAQATTTDYQRNGFPSPVAWVYVEGHALPPNAIVGGVDRRGPWHIARVFYEGSLELGKAGRHFRLGACITYHGKERDVDTYEVLVEANLPTRWVYQSLLPPLPLPRPLEQPTVCIEPRSPPQLTLADFKLVVIIDDSDSMDGKLWPEARDALAGVAELSRLKGGEGLDIYCLNSPKYRLDLRNEVEVHDFFNDIVPDGQTPTGYKLKQILDIYVPKIEDPSLRHKPISILVITDGVPTDDPRSVIVEFARRLDVKNVPLRHLSIQFVQIGGDPDATEALKELDELLGPANGVRDMVDTIPFSQSEPSLRADLIVNIVLGAINSPIERGRILQSVPHY